MKTMKQLCAGKRAWIGGGVAMVAMVTLIGGWTLSANARQDTGDARAMLVGVTDQHDDIQPIEAEPTASPSPTPVPSAVPPAFAPVQPPPEEKPPATRGGVRIPAATVAIDPGHGGSDSGAVYNDPAGGTVKEKDLTLQVALRAQKLLAEDGLRVVMTRDRDVGLGSGEVAADLQARVDVANAAKADLFVSIHFNASANPASQGTEVLYNASRPYGAQNLRLAQDLNDSIVSAIRSTGYPDANRGVKTDQSVQGAPLYLLGSSNYITRPSLMPAALGEALFISNPREVALMKDPGFLDTLAQAYAEGILTYLTQ